MKKILLSLSIIALFVSVVGCSSQKEWTREQKQQMRENLRMYREMAYIQNLTDAEYMLFADQVAMSLENLYPSYVELVEMPGMNDSVQVVVVTTIVDQLNADARNMRHLYPYNQLVMDGVLPEGLSRDQLKSFYSCFAEGVNNTYTTIPQFVNAIVADTVNNSQIKQIETMCASQLFDWTVTEIDVIETN